MAIKMINNNQNIDRELIESLLKEKPKLNFDLRIGTLCLVIAFAFFLIGFQINNHDYYLAKLSLFGMGLFPGLIGITLLAFHVLKIKNN